MSIELRFLVDDMSLFWALALLNNSKVLHAVAACLGVLSAGWLW